MSSSARRRPGRRGEPLRAVRFTMRLSEWQVYALGEVAAAWGVAPAVAAWAILVDALEAARGSRHRSHERRAVLGASELRERRSGSRRVHLQVNGGQLQVTGPPEARACDPGASDAELGDWASQVAPGRAFAGGSGV